MARPLKIAAVTGGRADWGLLSVPLARLRDDPAFDLSIIVTGQHLTSGETSLASVEAEGFDIAAKVDLDLGDDSARGVARSAGLALSGIGDALKALDPDLMLVLGDRYEILSAGMAALIARVPVAHLCGGDITEGAIDDSIRHALTKLSHIHFVTNADARQRVLQLGEDPAHVHCVGSPGLDRIRLTTPMARKAFFQSIGLEPRAQNLLITYHPVTLDEDPLAEAREMLAALDGLGGGVGLIFTGSNADPGARGIDGLVGAFVVQHPNAIALRTLGAERYFSALAHVDAVVGNSSSGLYEAPSFKLATVNIGDRQKGRLRARSVIDCAGERGAIADAIAEALRLDATDVENPYGDGHAAERIVAVLKTVGNPRELVRKRFVDLKPETR